MRQSFAPATSLLVLSTALTIAACGGDDRPSSNNNSNNNSSNNNTNNNNTNNNNNGPAAIMQFCADAKAKFGTYLASCYGGDESVLTGLFDLECDAWPAEVMAGHRNFDSTKIAACLAYFDTLTCEAGFDEAPNNVCEQAIMGIAPLSTVCEDDDICAAGLYCNSTSSDCPGVCAARAALGAACELNAFNGCVDGAFCENDNAGAGVCVAAIQAGQACTSGQCDRNLTCSNDICVGPKGLGEACDGFCAGFMRCEGPQGSRTCQLPAKVGDACDATTICAFGGCGMDGLCGGPAKVGDACGLMGMSYIPCFQGYCDTPDFNTPGLCAAQKADNATCMMDQECESSSCQAGMCAAPMCQ